MKRFKLILIAILVVSLAGLWSYAGPTTIDVKVIDTEVKRVGVGNTSKDQYRIDTIRVSDNSTLVFRNTDAALFPPYFKWDSADLQTTARTYAKRDATGPTVRIKYYGWRVKLLSWFPNATSMWTVESGSDGGGGETSAPGTPLPKSN